MAGQLSDLIEYIGRHEKAHMDITKDDYRKAISSSNEPEGLAMAYIDLCEQLQFEISSAEQQSLFPITNEKMTSWLHQQGADDEFQPKLGDLLKALEQDLINQWTNPYMAPRVKIGVIGYTSAGKSSLINRLLGVKSLDEDGAAPVSTKKSTYFPCQYDRSEPLIDPTDPNKKTLVTFVDLQGLDENRTSNNSEMSPGNYLDEIRKADCDIYVIVFDKPLSDVQKKWINEIEETLNRCCVLVRSKIDEDFLTKFSLDHKQFYSLVQVEERIGLAASIIKQLRQDNAVDSREVHLLACSYRLSTVDSAILQKEHYFDFHRLLDTLGELAAKTHLNRIHTLGTRTLVRVINTCFRRGYILNVMKYKVAAGFAAILPFADQLPRYLARDGIRKGYGIDNDLHDYLRCLTLNVHGYKLQTSVFENSVKIDETQTKSSIDGKLVVKTIGTTCLVMGGSVLDDIVRVVAPTATVLSGVGRVVFTVGTLGVGVVITLAVCVWSAHDSGKHIFSYVNRLCDDLIMITDAFVIEIIRRQHAKSIDSKKNENNAQ